MYFISSHKIYSLFLHFLGLIIVIKGVYSAELSSDYQGTVSFLAIVSTFGASLTGVGVLLSGDCLRRISLNIDILFKDILEQKEPWRRWPFLKRKSQKKDLNNNIVEGELKNPEISFFVGTHSLDITLPTVEDDFFDLPVIKNLWRLLRFESACVTLVDASNSNIFEGKTSKNGRDQHMAFICLKDIWLYIFKYRFFRYLTHLGMALSLYSFIFWFYLSWI